MVQLKKDWEPNAASFRKLLLWLDEGSDSVGERYLEVRRRLELYFDRKNCPSSDELADETLNRVARKLDEMGAITNVTPLHYCYIVAKFVFLESLRDGKRREMPLPKAAADAEQTSFGADYASTEDREKVAACLDHCLSKISAADREIILPYYQAQQRDRISRRGALAAHLGLTANALTIRACRIRQKLEICVQACAQKR
jgi:DNA-directed RNA polymerase specialized sigma24 family protein